MMINILLESSRKSGGNLVNAVLLYTELLNTDTPLPSSEIIETTLEQFSGDYFGWNKKEVTTLLKELKSTPEDVDSSKVLQLIKSYELLIEERLQSFDSLLYFLSAGAIIQFIFLIVTTRKALLTGEQLKNSEQAKSIGASLTGESTQDKGTMITLKYRIKKG